MHWFTLIPLVLLLAVFPLSLISQMLAQDIVKTESQKQGKDASIIWQSYAMEKLVILEGVLGELVRRKDQVPRLLEVGNMILKTSSGIRSNNHKKDFEPLLAGASALVIVLWKSYNEAKAKYHSLDWPPPKLRKFLDELVDTMCCVHKLMRRKCEKNLAKRVLVGCFGIRDLGKFDRYQRRLGDMALGLEKTPHNINIHSVLLAVVNSQAQPVEDELSELVEGESPLVKKGARKKGADRATAGLHQVGKSTTAKPAAPKDDEDNRKVNHRLKNKDNSKHERSMEDKPGRKTNKYTNFDKEAREKQSDEEDNAAPSDTRSYEDRKQSRDRIPKRKGRLRTILGSPQNPPLSSPGHRASTISEISPSFNNGDGIMINENVGNIYNSTIWPL